MSSALSIQQEIFLSRFTEAIRQSIIEYGKRITDVSGSNDVLMFMARKSVCLAEALRLLHLTSFQCTATSNRVLDMDTAWLEGKKVALFDDALISGTSLFRTKTLLEQLGCIVSIHVLCVNYEVVVK